MKLKAADAIWVAVANLHRDNPSEQDFPVDLIVERTLAEDRTSASRITIQTHVYRHCVANLEPKNATYRMLQQTTRGRRRLHWPGDRYHPGRQGAPDQLGTRITPLADDLPVELRPHLEWYADQARRMNSTPGGAADPLLNLRGAAAGLWRDETPDEYVRRLRAGWP